MHMEECTFKMPSLIDAAGVAAFTAHQLCISPSPWQRRIELHVFIAKLTFEDRGGLSMFHMSLLVVRRQVF